MTDDTILVAPLLAVELGHNVAPAAWSPLEDQISHIVARTDTGKSTLTALLLAKLRAEAAHLARARELLFTHSYEDAVTQLARQALSDAHPSGLVRLPRTALPRPVAPPVDQMAVRGFDIDVQVLWTRTPVIAELVQRAGRVVRSTPRGGGGSVTVSHIITATGALDIVDEVDVSDVVHLVRAGELRRLAKVERRLRVALRSLADAARVLASWLLCAPSRAASFARLPLTGARTLTAPPLAA